MIPNSEIIYSRILGAFGDRVILLTAIDFPNKHLPSLVRIMTITATGESPSAEWDITHPQNRRAAPAAIIDAEANGGELRMTGESQSNLSLRICQALATRSSLTEDGVALLIMENGDTRIDIFTCLDGLESCGIIQCKLDEEEEWIYSISPVWKDRFVTQRTCSGCHHE